MAHGRVKRVILVDVLQLVRLIGIVLCWELVCAIQVQMMVMVMPSQENFGQFEEEQL